MLEQGARRAEIPLHVLGLGQEFQGYGWMREQLADTVDQITRSKPEQLLLIADAYDVILSPRASQTAFLSVFQSFPSPIVVSAEGFGTNAIQNGLAKLVFGSCLGTYINSGLVCGRAKHLSELFALWREEEAISKENNDQLSLSRACRRHEDWFRKHVSIDTGMRMFATSTCFTTQHRFAHLLARAGFDQMPLLFHGNGNCSMQDLVLAFGFDAQNILPRPSYTWTVFLHYAKLVCNRYKYVGMISLLLLACAWWSIRGE